MPPSVPLAPSVPEHRGKAAPVSQADINIICSRRSEMWCSRVNARVRAKQKKLYVCDAHLTLKSSAASLALSISSMIRAFSRFFFLTFRVNNVNTVLSSGYVPETW